MINFAKHQEDNAEEICLIGEQSHSASPEVATPHAGNGLLAEFLHLTLVESPDRAQLKAAQRIEISLRYMMQHINQPMKVSTLSAMAGLSDSSFFALFKSATGRTPLDFFIRARMHRAGELLAETTLQIKVVAAMLGYDDQFYFSRRFKSVHGIAPREYRAQKEKSIHQNFKQKPAHGQPAAAYLPPHLSRLVQAGGNPVSERVLGDRFQPPTQRPQAFHATGREASSRPDPACSVSLHL